MPGTTGAPAIYSVGFSHMHKATAHIVTMSLSNMLHNQIQHVICLQTHKGHVSMQAVVFSSEPQHADMQVSEQSSMSG